MFSDTELAKIAEGLMERLERNTLLSEMSEYVVALDFESLTPDAWDDLQHGHNVLLEHLAYMKEMLRYSAETMNHPALVEHTIATLSPHQ